jgi:uncharacterized protein (DUF362 family)
LSDNAGVNSATAIPARGKRISRRRLVRIGLVGAIGAAGLAGYSGLGMLRFVPGMARAQWLAALGGVTPVGVVRCPSYASAGVAVRAAWELGGGPPVRGKRVILKPNLIDFMPDHPINTSPELIGAVIDYLAANGAAEVIVADGPGFTRDAEQLLAASGLGEVLRRRAVSFVDLNYDDLRERALVGNYGRQKSLLLPRTILEADLVVSMPKMKTHHWTGVSLSMKNLFGVVPGVKYGWPKNVLHWNTITASILTLYETVHPGFALVDGVVGMEGDGPIYGTARPSGVLVAGSDFVAVDSTATRVMGIDPADIDHLYAAGKLGLGRLSTGSIAVRGEPIEAVAARFGRPSNQLLQSIAR